MSNPFEDNDSSDVLEGFLCPICKSDLKTPERLTSHVETEHFDEQDLLRSLKDLFSVAKNKFYKNIDDTVDLAKNIDNSLKPKTVREYAPFGYSEKPQEIGTFCDHMSYFNAIRSPRIERYTTDANQLIIRIHKLLTNLPADASQRRQHEQTIVPWLDGKSVKLCPNCAKSFFLTRRQHHCRLCGSIMCNDCSRELAIVDAVSLIGPSVLNLSDATIVPVDNQKEIEGLRVCEHCLHLLDNRREMQDSRTYRPKIVEMYDKIQKLKKEILPEIPVYMKIIDSLYEGDTIFTLQDAGALRGKLGRGAEAIDTLSKAITGIPCEPGTREESLKKAVRMDCVRLIKDDLLSIPPLPVEEVIEKIRVKRRQETELMIEKDRRLAREAMERYDLGGSRNSTQIHSGSSSSNSSATGVAVTALDNWSGFQNSDTKIKDPLLEQINIIRGYIKQARLAMRFEEVAILEINLRELQQEFYNRQQHNDSVPAS